MQEPTCVPELPLCMSSDGERQAGIRRSSIGSGDPRVRGLPVRANTPSHVLNRRLAVRSVKPTGHEGKRPSCEQEMCSLQLYAA